jgi:hypothetical protein
MLRPVSSRHLSALAATAAGLLLALAAPAGANFVVTGADPEGDASDPHPGRDINALAMEYDPETGSLNGDVRFRGAPGDDGISLMTLAAGTRTPTGCDGYPAAILASSTDEYDGGWFRFDAPGVPSAAKGFANKVGFDEAVQSFNVEAPELRDRRYDCAVATITEPGNASRIYDTTVGVDLVGVPELGVRVSGVPRKLKPGRAKRITVRVTNPGDGPATGVRLHLSRERGLTRTPGRRSLGTLAPGASRVVRVKVRLGSRASTSTELGVVARARENGLVVRDEVTLRLVRPDGGGGGGDPDFTPRTCTRWSPDPFGDTGGSLILVPC